MVVAEVAPATLGSGTGGHDEAAGQVEQVGVAHGVDVRRHRLTAAATEHDDVEQGVGAETVGAVHGDARALAGGVEAGEHRVGGVDHDLGVDVGGNPAHGVVGGGLDGN